MKKMISFAAATALLGTLFMQSALASANAEVFKNLDVDANGQITKQEAEAHADLPDAFDEGDENNDGVLDMVEFEKLEITDE